METREWKEPCLEERQGGERGCCRLRDSHLEARLGECFHVLFAILFETLGGGNYSLT